MKNTTRHVPPVRDPTRPEATMVPAATAELPAFFTERFSWDRPPLEEIHLLHEERERTGEVRSGDIYDHHTRSLHERSPTWMAQVPQTRYDQLYAITHPDVARIGIRRHLDAEYVNRTEVIARDEALVRKSVSGGRRLRHRVENAPTHRKEGSLLRNAK
ncbi:unnamed protein product [Phytomonas sp. Hart1]|nr:unnamed protein product [Phytomonas sp. Hart1]|eukprot:CCW67449.1 unnamed protein product [Phytomonas sp. isolate Hart1]